RDHRGGDGRPVPGAAPGQHGRGVPAGEGGGDHDCPVGVPAAGRPAVVYHDGERIVRARIRTRGGGGGGRRVDVTGEQARPSTMTTTTSMTQFRSSRPCR